MGRFDDIMPFGIDPFLLLFGLVSPQHEYHPPRFLIHLLDDSISKGFPSLVFMGVGLMGPRTVRTVFNINTPWRAQGIRCPLLGTGCPRSSSNSLNMFFREGGITRGVRKRRVRGRLPRCASRSCPRITSTFTCSYGVKARAEKRSSSGG